MVLHCSIEQSYPGLHKDRSTICNGVEWRILVRDYLRTANKWTIQGGIEVMGINNVIYRLNQTDRQTDKTWKILDAFGRLVVWSFTVVLTACEGIPRSLVYPSEGVQKVFRCKNLKSVDNMLLITGFLSLTKALDKSALLACDEPPLSFLLSIWPSSFTHTHVWL